jgi:hypothetical protein
MLSAKLMTGKISIPEASPKDSFVLCRVLRKYRARLMGGAEFIELTVSPKSEIE